tara:strand:+ start:1038 stop:1217 length:180 start_codon:yes stop_codon:yes gene_type:complete
MELNKLNGIPTFSFTKDFNTMKLPERLSCLREARKTIEKEIDFTEQDMGKYLIKNNPRK